MTPALQSFAMSPTSITPALWYDSPYGSPNDTTPQDNLIAYEITYPPLFGQEFLDDGSGKVLKSSDSVLMDTDPIETESQKYYYALIAGISQILLSEDLDEEDGEVPPTEYAVHRALTLLASAYESLRYSFPRAVVSTMFDGGLRLQWMRGVISVRVIIPSNQDEEEYIYFEDEHNYDTEPVTARALVERLDWLQQSVRNAEAI